MVKILIVLAVLVVIGVIVVTVLAASAPRRLATLDGHFRYDLATALIFGWWLSVIWLVIWALSWPARKLVSKKVTQNR